MKTLLAVILICLANIAFSDDSIDDAKALAERGKELYSQTGSCWLCHGEKAEGRVGPSLKNGPTPFDINYQFQNNPQMGPLGAEMKASKEDLLALSVYIKTLVGTEIADVDVEGFRNTLASIQLVQKEIVFPLSERDKKIQEIELFQTVLDTWERKSKTGNIKHDYDTKVVGTWEPGKPLFKPRPGRTYFYENTGINKTTFATDDGKLHGLEATQVVVGDARTKKVIAHAELPEELRAGVHTTAMTPDGKYVYMIGARPIASKDSLASDPMSLLSPATMLKIDALSLKPVKQFTIGGRIHHAQLFQDKHILIDTFGRDVDGLDVFLLDPETDKIIGGVRDEELGGSTYTAFSDDEYIYILMEPAGYSALAYTGYLGAMDLATGKFTTMRPYWITKIDPKTWEVVKEYPYPGFRGDWLCFDSAKEYMYVPSGGSGNVTKIHVESGNIEWTSPTGTGPYGCGLNADESEVWVADKGETTRMFGRTVTVVAASDGRQLHTLPSAYQVDHILLSPNGKEFWLTSNGEGKVLVFNADTRKLSKTINMPGYGDAHGLVWVHYDKQGNSKVVGDQGGFHNGVDPRNGAALKY